MSNMSELVPTRAYDLLEEADKAAVEEYVQFAVQRQHDRRERIINAIYYPIPTEYIRRSRNAMYKPVVLAAVSERLKEEATKQDISPDRVISEHMAIATAELHSYFEEGEFGQMTPKAIEKLTPEQRKAVKAVEVKPNMYGLGFKLVLHDKHASLKALGEMMGLVAPDRPPALVEYIKPALQAPKNAAADVKAYEDILGA